MVSISIKGFWATDLRLCTRADDRHFFEYGLGPYLSKSIASAAIDKHQERAAYGLPFADGSRFYFVCTSGFLPWAGFPQPRRLYVGWRKRVHDDQPEFFYGYYQGKEQHNTEFLSTGTEMLIQVCVIILVFNADLDVLGVAQAYFVGRIIAWFASYAIFAWRQYLMIPALDRQFWQRVLQDALPFNLTFVAAFAITSLDTILLQILASDDPDYQVGLYQADHPFDSHPSGACHRGHASVFTTA